MAKTLVRWFEELSVEDVAEVGGKNASLGEMVRTLGGVGVQVPAGFALTSDAYWEFIDHSGLRESIGEVLDELAHGDESLEGAGARIRSMMLEAELPDDVAKAAIDAYERLSARYGVGNADVAVRSSATAEDLPDASFAGQQETFLNVVGVDDLLDACRRCFASLFTDRAISYRQRLGLNHLDVALSVGVQKMIRSDLAGSGVMFTLDTETGFPDLVVINAAWGLGEMVVQGKVNPDEYRVFKPLLGIEGVTPIIDSVRGSKEIKLIYGDRGTVEVETERGERDSLVLTDEEILELARAAVTIEGHYQRPMDIEWAKDGETGDLHIVQARPETVESRREAAHLKSYRLTEEGDPIVEGAAIGDAIAAGRAFVLLTLDQADEFEDGGILVTDMTDPDWVPVMRRATAIVTDLGGRTSHAAIVSRELGVPAVVGTGRATSVIGDGDDITVSCAEGEIGHVYRGLLDFEAHELDFSDMPDTSTRIMLNLADPEAALRWWRLPCHGVGLARMEFIINQVIKAHPMALVHFDRVTDETERQAITELTEGYEDKTRFFVDHLARGIAKIAISQWPDPVIVRTSDFKSNEYAQLLGGRAFELDEENPMLGLRGASRYTSDRYREAFVLECEALARVRDDMGLDNVVVMIPFCRTLEEADAVLDLMAANRLRRSENGLEIFVMAEIPANVVLAGEFADRFDGFSIGSNDLTQLVLGVDRDSAELARLFDERNPAVKEMIRSLISAAHDAGTKVGICGQAPSDYPDFVEFLVEQGIDSMSLNPDSVIPVLRAVAAAESRIREPVSVR